MATSRTAYCHMYFNTLERVIKDFHTQIKDYQLSEKEGMKLDKKDKKNLRELIKERDLALEIYNSGSCVKLILD